MADLILADRLVKEFGTKRVVDDVSLTVNRGEVLGFLGPNGAGKSTTMKMLTGFLKPTSGHAAIGGHDVAAHPMAARRMLGYLPEGAPLYPDMTPWGLLKFCAEIRGVSARDRRSRIEQAIAMTNLEGVVTQPIDTLSKGFKRRVGLAQALLHDPDVLILDEPTDGLDPNQKHEVRDLIGKIAAEKAIVISTHILEEVEAICSRAVIIAAGRVIADDSPAALAERSVLFNAVAVILSKDLAERGSAALQDLDQVAEVRVQAMADGQAKLIAAPKDGHMILNTVAGALADANVDVVSVRPEASALEDLFRQLTRGTEQEAA